MTVETETLNEEVQRILANSEKPLTTQDIYDRSDLAESPADVAKSIRELHDEGEVVDWPAAEGGRRRRYWTAENATAAAAPHSGESDAEGARNGGSAQGGAGASGGSGSRRDAIREVFRRRRLCTIDDLASELGIGRESRQWLRLALKDMTRAGELIRVDQGVYRSPWQQSRSPGGEIEPPAAFGSDSAGSSHSESCAAAEPVQADTDDTAAVDLHDVVEPERFGLTSDGHLLIYYPNQDRPTELSEDATRDLANFIAATWIGIDPLGKSKEASHE